MRNRLALAVFFLFFSLENTKTAHFYLESCSRPRIITPRPSSSRHLDLPCLVSLLSFVPLLCHLEPSWHCQLLFNTVSHLGHRDCSILKGRAHLTLLFFKYKFIYLSFYFWLRWVFIAARGLSLVAASGSYSLLQCVGFSLQCLLSWQSTGSRRAGSVVVASGL